MYLVGTAHLDTQWNWTIQQTITDFLPSTFLGNFYRFNEFPSYEFSFEGAFRYMLIKEYYPDAYARIKEYVDSGRWHVVGSTVDAMDVNVPSPESLIRQVLCGNGFYKKEFGKTSCDIFLPDCFGFGYALPSIAAFCGLKGFSTQKLTWGSADGIPFDLGRWIGPDGSSVIAAPNAGSYRNNIGKDLSSDPDTIKQLDNFGAKSGVYAGYKYFGTGDRGGVPGPSACRWAETGEKASGPVKVINSASDQIYRDITPEQAKGLPEYKGELVMTSHGVGCYTSESAMKRWNRKNELLAEAAEKASSAAAWLGTISYPKDTLRDAWVRFLWHQFHDDLTGTSTPQVYSFSWNDEILAMNRFADVLNTSASAVISKMDTRTKDFPVVVFNPVSIDRQDIVKAQVQFPNGTPKAVRVFGPDGKETPSQMVTEDDGRSFMVFLAKVPSIGFAVYDVRPSTASCKLPSNLKISKSGMENEYYKVTIDRNGDVSSIYDKTARREFLAGPARLEMLAAKQVRYPAWEIAYDIIKSTPREYVGGPADIRIVENGPARVSLEIHRKAAGSTFIQRISLASGTAGRRVEFANEIDWKTKGTLLKAVFPLAVKNEKATYDLGLGVISRGLNTEKKYEVPAQQWADLTDQDGSCGVTVMNDCKYGWDKPDDNTLRLSLLYTPETGDKYPYQGLQDIGGHKITYAICGHKGSWNNGDSVSQANNLNQPLAAFQASAHQGFLGKTFCFARTSSPNVRVKSIKQAEGGSKLVVRLQETSGCAVSGVTMRLAGNVSEAGEVNGSEEHIGPAVVKNGKLVVNMRPFQPKAFTVKLAGPVTASKPQACALVDLSYNTDGVSFDKEKNGGNIDGNGQSIPAEIFPAKVTSGGVSFKLGPAECGKKNVLSCQGQTIKLRSNGFDRLCILASSVNGDKSVVFLINGKPVKLKIDDMTENVGRWYSRVVDSYRLPDPERLLSAYIKTDPVAFTATHLHDKDGNNGAYNFGNIFRYSVGLPRNVKTLKLPDDPSIKVFAITLTGSACDSAFPVTPVMDEVVPSPAIKPYGNLFVDHLKVQIDPMFPGVQVRYTLDGSDPSSKSPVCAGSIDLTNTATVKAAAFRNGRQIGAVSVATFEKTAPREPDNPQNLVHGLDFAYYESVGKNLPDFEKRTPESTGSTSYFNIDCGKRTQDIAIRFTGFIDVPRDGVYRFYTKTNGENRLYIGDTRLTGSNFSHGEKQVDLGSVALKKGKHAITLEWQTAEPICHLDVSWSGPGIRRQNIPENALYRLNK